MDYTTARKLKDAGFPQEGGEHLMNHESLKIPTLEEIIESCPKTYNVPEYIDAELGFCLKYTIAEWSAGYIHYDHMPLQEYGSTPSEAVANLFIVLSKNK